jgi:SP family arabinose:H+ symporter-like MFS transporter
MSQSASQMRFLWAICLVAAMGGLLFGYDWVVIGGAKPFYEVYFDIADNPFHQGFAMSGALLGCLVGAAASGALTDRYGRKPLLIWAGFLFTVSAVWTALAYDLLSFNIARLVGGVGIGLASNLSPMYIAEVSPASNRGRFVSINQLTVVIGILAAQLVNWGIAFGVPEELAGDTLRDSWYGQSAWRWMFAAETLPAAAFFVLMFFMPESPRWLVKAGREEEAAGTLRRLGGEEMARSEIADIRRALAEDDSQATYAELLRPDRLRVLTLGVGLAVLQQWCGINVIFNYAQEVFSAAGYGVNGVMATIVLTGVVNLVFTLLAVATVDRIGRRPLMIGGSIGLAVIYTALGAAYHFDSRGTHMVLLILAAIACYAMTLAPVTWVVISEIFPTRIRGAAVSVAVMALWIACTVLTFSFPFLNRSLGPDGTFWLYAAICAAGALFVWRRLPETKDLTLEEIERQMARGKGSEDKALSWSTAP